MSTAPSRPAPRPPSERPAATATGGGVRFGSIRKGNGHRVLLYGPGGIGKTTLACSAPGPVAIFDFDDSLPRIAGSLAGDIRVIDGVETWQAMRDALASPGWDEIRTIIIDTLTRAEELAVAHTLATVPSDGKNNYVKRTEDYPYGKGYQYIYDTFLPLLSDLDAHVKRGRNVILVAHDCTTNVPNPGGADWLRYEPRLQSPPSGKGSIRLRVREWVDHLLYIGYDVAVSSDGKGVGRGTRTAYTRETPTCMAKRRKETDIADSIPVAPGSVDVWDQLMMEGK